MDVVKPESCDQKFEKPNKLSNCCRYKIRAFEDVSAIQIKCDFILQAPWEEL